MSLLQCLTVSAVEEAYFFGRVLFMNPFDRSYIGAYHVLIAVSDGLSGGGGLLIPLNWGISVGYTCERSISI
jgi:hypothetical protein